MAKWSVAQTAIRDAAYRALYDTGWPDGRIAKAFRTQGSVVAAWRDGEGLPNKNRPAVHRIDSGRARQLYRDGRSDTEIAAELGVNTSSICVWRHKNGLPSHWKARKLEFAAVRRAARKMLKLGASKAQVSAAVGLSTRGIQDLRRGMNDPHLRQSSVHDSDIRKRVLGDATIARRIRSAVGEGLPPDVRADACGDLYAAVLSGEIAVELIEAQAPHFRNRAWTMSGSSFGARSLDDPLISGEDITLGDMIEDPNALEQMEEAVERALSYR